MQPALALQNFARRDSWWSQIEGIALALALDRVAGSEWRQGVFGSGGQALGKLLDQSLQQAAAAPGPHTLTATEPGRSNCQLCRLAAIQSYSNHVQIFGNRQTNNPDHGLQSLYGHTICFACGNNCTFVGIGCLRTACCTRWSAAATGLDTNDRCSTGVFAGVPGIRGLRVVGIS